MHEKNENEKYKNTIPVSSEIEFTTVDRLHRFLTPAFLFHILVVATHTVAFQSFYFGNADFLHEIESF